jgi:hypothetical protein
VHTKYEALVITIMLVLAGQITISVPVPAGLLVQYKPLLTEQHCYDPANKQTKLP